VVENELAAHDPLRHIAVQILEFSLSFETDPRTVKAVLLNALQEQPEAKRRSEQYATTHRFRNLDHMLEYLIYEAPFAALVVIDELPDTLESVLAQRFSFGVEVLELAKYQNDRGERVYHFEPFLADLREEAAAAGEFAEAEVRGWTPLRWIRSLSRPEKMDSRRLSSGKIAGMRSGYTGPCGPRSNTLRPTEFCPSLRSRT
jgi:hypothetical protein